MGRINYIVVFVIISCLTGCSGGISTKFVEESQMISSCINLDGYEKTNYIDVERPFIIVRIGESVNGKISFVKYSDGTHVEEKTLEDVKTVITVSDEYITSIDYGKNNVKMAKIEIYAANVRYFDVKNKKYMERLFQNPPEPPKSISRSYSHFIKNNEIIKAVTTKADGLDKFAHHEQINSLVFTPDRKMLISGSGDGYIKFWSLPDGELLKKIGEPGAIPVRHFPDGTESLVTFDYREIQSLACTPDGKILVSCGFDRAIKFWSLPDGTLIKNIDFWKSNTIVEENQKDRMLNVTISPNGKILASSSYENVIRLWSLPEGELLKTLELGKYTGSLVFSPDGKLLVSRGDDDNTIQLWSMPEGNRLNVLKDNNRVNKLCISPDGKWLISGGYGTITIWELPEGKQVKNIRTGGDWVEALIVTADNKLLGEVNNRIVLWSLPEGEQLKIVGQGERMICALSNDVSGTLLATSQYDGSLQIWKMPEVEMITRIWDVECSPKY